MEQQANQKKHKIGNIGAAVLIISAIIADLITLIPLAGDIVGPLFFILSSLYFWKIGLGFATGRRFTTNLTAMIAELIPGVQELPMIAIGAIAIVIMTRAEEKTGISMMNLGKKPGVTPPRIQKSPLNQGGKRLPPKIQSVVK